MGKNEALVHSEIHVVLSTVSCQMTVFQGSRVINSAQAIIIDHNHTLRVMGFK